MPPLSPPVIQIIFFKKVGEELTELGLLAGLCAQDNSNTSAKLYLEKSLYVYSTLEK